jgi:hypothetical protein
MDEIYFWPLNQNYMKYLSFLILFISITLSSQAKIWRVNNNPGVTADFTTFHAAVGSASVLAGDTLHFESSTADYVTNGITLTKRLVLIGTGYFLNPADVNFPANTGLQAATAASSLQGFTIGDGANGTKLLGLVLSSITVAASASPINLVIEKCYNSGGIYFNNATHNGITVRKCFFGGSRIECQTGSLTNFVCENNIFYSTFAFINLPTLTGSTNIFRNNSFKDVGVGNIISNCYVANNIFGSPQSTFTNCTIKNNLFSANQPLPGTATSNQVNVNITNVYVGGTTGSQDSRAMLKTGSPAIGAGLTIGAVVSPDCGAFGATDPYKLSGIPNIPSIYTLTVPISVPSGSTTMGVTLSTRNNN